MPGQWICSDSKEYGIQMGIDGAGFIGMQDTAGSVDEVKIIGFSHLQDTGALRGGMNGAEPILMNSMWKKG